MPTFTDRYVYSANVVSYGHGTGPDKAVIPIDTPHVFVRSPSGTTGAAVTYENLGAGFLSQGALATLVSGWGRGITAGLFDTLDIPDDPPGPLVAGTIDVAADGPTSLRITATPATGGVGPYAYALHRATSSGFTPSAGNRIDAAWDLDTVNTGLATGTTYYYKYVVTDSSSNTATSNQDSGAPSAGALVANVIDVTVVSATSLRITGTAASGGATPYTYALHRSTTNNFTPTAGNRIDAAWDRDTTDTGLATGVTYYYKCVVTDNAAGSATSAQDSATPTGGGSTPAWIFDPSSYASFAAFEASPEHIYTWSPGQVTLETGPILGGGTGKFVRASFTSGGGPQLVEYRGIDIQMGTAARVREVWIEYELRFADSWVLQGPPPAALDDKTIFVLQDKPGIGTEIKRWDAYLRGSSPWGSADDGSVEFYPLQDHPDPETELWDGQWHRLRVHFRIPWNNDGSGIWELWWDNLLMHSASGFSTPNTPTNSVFRVLALGRNTAVQVPTYRDWGRVKVYTSEPAGWP